MIQFLVRRFVKNYEDTENTDVRTAYGILSSVVGIFCNVLLFGVKFAIGLLMRSMAVTADAFNNLSDAASSVIGFVGVKMASKPADKDHPFGHGRMEYIAALIVSFLVIEVGITFFRSAIDKIRNPEELAFSWISFIILALSVGVKLWLSVFNRTLGRRIDSKVMLATAADSMGDVITTSATLASIIVCRFTGANIDGIVGLLVSVIVIWSGISIARDTLEPLIGRGADPKLYADIKELVESYDGIVGTHDLIIHNYGPGRSMASIHAEVPRDVDIETSHEVIDRAEREVSKKLGIFLVIHMDPVEIHDARVLAIREKLGRVLRALDEQLTFHDFRVVFGKEQINLIFDLVVPFTYNEQEEVKLSQQVMALMQEVDARYQCVITMDRSFVAEEE
ncbi:MAG TPA: cation transporter [Candidatus Scatomonas pullistercoris]|uniref:Cation transporter n=1 Tax=Candidatus Scatomonas pullistercoris TaxID=2840920 RepID=A0A9D1P5D5_9FIRM|nr:cation transporter [Candidatus Scatomonas pullistercoris]